MKSFKLILIAIATVGFSSLYSCGGGSKDASTSDTTKIQSEPTVEQTVDTTANADTLKKIK
jgi:hypothetical protein